MAESRLQQIKAALAQIDQSHFAAPCQNSAISAASASFKSTSSKSTAARSTFSTSVSVSAKQQKSCSFEVAREKTVLTPEQSPPVTLLESPSLAQAMILKDSFAKMRTSLTPQFATVFNPSPTDFSTPTTASSNVLETPSFPKIAITSAPYASDAYVSDAYASDAYVSDHSSNHLPAATQSTAEPVNPVRSESIAQSKPSRTPASATLTTITVQPFAVQPERNKEPSLPRVKVPGLEHHRHSTNPCFAMSLLQDIASVVIQWQTDLESIHTQIQDIYMSGPIVDGWLETDTFPDGTIQGYRLCGLDESGDAWSYVCPLDQLPSVSIAIARYQQLRQLIARKQSLETRLTQLGVTLTEVRSRL